MRTAQIELASSNAHEIEHVPARIEHGPIAKDPGRPCSPDGLQPEPEPALAKRPRHDCVPPVAPTQAGALKGPDGEAHEVDETELDALFSDDECTGYDSGCGCAACMPEEDGHADDCGCGFCGPCGTWAWRRGDHPAQRRAARA